MSIAPLMVVCPKCGGGGTINLFMPLNHCQKYFTIKDICDKCGGSGKIAYKEV